MKYCLYLNIDYLHYYRAVRASLLQYTNAENIWTLALDDETYKVLKNLKNVISFSIVENDNLRKAEPTRTRKEYIWTIKASWILWLLKNVDIDGVTYLDVDMYFFGSPDRLNSEIQKHSVAITPHRFAAQHQHFVQNGIFNIGYVYFKNDTTGIAACERWATRCINWCYHRHEDNKFTEQRYLDTWPEDWGAYIIEHPGVNLAPWNQIQYQYALKDGQVFVAGYPLVFYHFHNGLNPAYTVHSFVKKHIYKTYENIL